MKTLVTGATGFIGNHLCRVLVEEGHEVIALVRPGSDIFQLQFLKNISFVFGDIQCAEHLDAVQEFPETLFHLAANWDHLDMNTDKQFFDYVIQRGTRNIIFYSSVCAYGLDKAPAVLQENWAPEFLPGDAYGIYKFGVEKYLLSLIAEQKVRGTVLRPTLVYGPGDANNIFSLVKSIRHWNLALWDHGKRIISPCNVVNLNRVAVDALYFNFNQLVINVADAEKLSTHYVTKVIAQFMGCKHRYKNWSSVLGFYKGFLMFVLNKLKLADSFITQYTFKTWTRTYDVDLTVLKGVIGKDRLVSFETGMKETVEWYQNEHII